MVLGMAWDEIRGYDNSDLQSVLQRARKMLGMELREIDMEIRGTSEFNSSNRGYAGLVIESWFVDGTNEAGPDLPNVPHPTLDHVGLEIKAVPLRRGKKKPNKTNAIVRIFAERYNSTENKNRSKNKKEEV